MDSAYANCLICDGAKLVPLPRFKAAHLVRCASCGLVFAGRRPSDHELADHYSGYGTAWQDSEITRSRYRALLDSFEPYRKSNRILDMGCGAGYFLEEATRRGWDAYGSEFGDLPLEMSRKRGFTVLQAPLPADAFPANHFDVITSFEVLEHLRDPRDEAAKLAHLMRPGGLLYCTTPNFNSVSRHLLGERWDVVDYPEHLIYFTGPILSNWLAKYGFHCTKRSTTGISPAALMRRLPSVRQPAAKPRTDEHEVGVDARARAVTESVWPLQVLKASINAGLTAFGGGDTIKASFIFLGHRPAT